MFSLVQENALEVLNINLSFIPKTMTYLSCSCRNTLYFTAVLYPNLNFQTLKSQSFEIVRIKQSFYSIFIIKSLS